MEKSLKLKDRMTPSLSSKSFFVLYLLLGGIILSIGLGTFGYIMTTPVWRDEMMYVPAAYLVAHGYIPYSDFPYVHGPVAPCLFALPMIFIKNYYFLTARLTHCAFVLAVGILLSLLAHRWSQNILLALASIMLLFTNETFRITIVAVTNHGPALFFALAALLIFKRNRFLTGVFIGIAAFTRIASIALLPAVALVELMAVRDGYYRNALRQKTVPLLAGFSLILAPVLVIMALNPYAALFDTFLYHNKTWMFMNIKGMGEGMDLAGKAAVLLRIISRRTNLPLSLAAAVALVAGLIIARRARRQLPVESKLIVLLVIFSSGATLVPTPQFEAYWSLPLIFLALMPVALATVLDACQAKLSCRHVLALIFLLITALSGQPNWQEMRAAFSPALWTPLKVHAWSQEITQLVGQGQTIATIGPVYAIDAGAEILPEFGSGPFLMRVSSLVSENDFRRMRRTSLLDFSTLFRNRMPAAIFAGVDGDVDRPLELYALQAHYHLAKGFPIGRLYLPD